MLACKRGTWWMWGLFMDPATFLETRLADPDPGHHKTNYLPHSVLMGAACLKN